MSDTIDATIEATTVETTTIDTTLGLQPDASQLGPQPDASLGLQPDGTYRTPYAITIIYDPTDDIQTIAAHLVANAQLSVVGSSPTYITPAVCALDGSDLQPWLAKGYQCAVEFIDAIIKPGFCTRELADVCGRALDPAFPICFEQAADAAACLRAYAKVHGAREIAEEFVNARATDSEKTSEYLARGRGIIEYLAAAGPPCLQ
jgi:hypothetical protein